MIRYLRPRMYGGEIGSLSISWPPLWSMISEVPNCYHFVLSTIVVCEVKEVSMLTAGLVSILNSHQIVNFIEVCIRRDCEIST